MTQHRPSSRPRALAGLIAGLLTAALAGPAAAQGVVPFDEAAALAAARNEPPITIYDSTGKIVDMAKSFSAKYGLKATGVKVSATSQLEMIIREAQANNVKGDVVLLTDTPAALAQLLPEKFVYSFLPQDKAAQIPELYRNPLAISINATVWAYNTEVYKTCPVTNMWQLTEPQWKRRVAYFDPLSRSNFNDFINQMATHHDAAVAKAYKDLYGKELKTSEESATAAWVKAFAANAPLVSETDERISEAVGAPGQKEPFFGFMSSAKFRDNKDKGYKLGLCESFSPWPAWSYTKLAMIATKTKSPNAAKLFINYILTPEGIMPQVVDGKVPTNPEIKLPDDEPSGLSAVLDRLLPFNAKTGLDDWDRRQDWQDLWRSAYKK
ncbi:MULTISPECIES: ABC transporter substrate-binding protein [Bosea]|uniref:ABC transporter substrate-binding protein n=1 Tax=Bosea TaxID=85413 RepID=UPI0021506394|nr:MULTISPECIES: ABC transporter substrate-binding protein [Bosea]MCR4520507.1 ABC transporter substrate-binding protein [Bosea sp. 47.2.35]MDR6827860.1 iron(III) transport system substrate-binding protein [Bosea robiniae]MDR6894446.1 iron(III) transport system substrate-binding protein [Bosea sp. BE109]MDR7137966.1 iron(III) transport system substrate-binding protein [Bosea sp. BE168]MDR7174665.1 iron(III) transport system substrate-binding protein [Bosea sp. BE271]